MLFSLRRQLSNLCILGVDLDALHSGDIVFTDGNAASIKTSFYCHAANLDSIPWTTLKTRYWSNCDDGKRKVCSEFLVYGQVAPDHVAKVACFSDESFSIVSSIGFDAALLRDPFR